MSRRSLIGGHLSPNLGEKSIAPTGEETLNLALESVLDLFILDLGLSAMDKL